MAAVTAPTAAVPPAREPEPDASGRPAGDIPRRADGLELIGEYESSGYRRPPSLVRRADGQTLQLTSLLYATVEAIDGQRDVAAVAARVSERVGRTVSAENVAFLIQEKLRPIGVLKLADGREPPVRKANPLLALRLRAELANERVASALARPVVPLFRPAVVFLVVVAFVAVTAWVLGVRGVATGTRELLYSPGLLLAIFAATIVSAAFHELGHAAACVYSGARPGGIGAGIYLMWPAFYTDVTDAYRLDRRGRLRTDLGGLYCNALFTLATFAVWLATGADAVLLLVPVQVFQMIHQLLPVIRMDGYHILADLVGVPDLFLRIKPTLRSMVPGVDTPAEAKALKPWVRVVVTLWVVLVVPLLLLALVLAVVSFPRVLATAWDSARLLWHDATSAFGDGAIATGMVGVVSLVALALPILGIGYVLVRLGRRIAAGAWHAAGRFRFGHAVLGPVAVAATVGVALLWWPNGEYRPIQPGERGTLGDAFETVGHLGTGRPALTPDRAEELEGAPFRADATSEVPPEPASDDPPTDAPSDPGPGSTTTLTSGAENGEPAPTSRPTPPSTTTEPATDPTTETSP